MTMVVTSPKRQLSCCAFWASAFALHRIYFGESHDFEAQKMYPRYIVVLLLLAGIAGCGGGYSGVPVSGKVTLNQKPLANANIAFYPIVDLTQKEPPYSYGKTDANGQFTLKLSNNDANGAVIGKHRVSITMENGDEDKGDAQSGPEKKSIIPLRYQGTASKLIFEVPVGGADNANFDLISP